MTRKLAVGSTLVVLALAGSGCGPSPGRVQAPGAHLKITQHIDISRVKTYTSISEVVGDSSLIAELTVKSQAQTTIGGIPFTVSIVSVDHILRGTAPAGTLGVDQVGTSTAVAEPLMALGGRYLAFLTPAPDGNYYVVGVAAGLYQDTGTSYLRMDTESPALPASASHGEMDTLVQAGP